MQPHKCYGLGAAAVARFPPSENALRVLQARHLRRDPARGRVIDMPDELLRRVANHVAQAEVPFRGAAAAAECETQFYECMISPDSLPNSPCLMNAGTPLRMLCAGFVLPVEDSMEGIFDALKLMALIQQSGGDVGFSFSRLRPNGETPRSMNTSPAVTRMPVNSSGDGMGVPALRKSGTVAPLATLAQGPSSPAQRTVAGRMRTWHRVCRRNGVPLEAAFAEGICSGQPRRGIGP